MAAESTSWDPDPMSERIIVRCYDSYEDAKRAVDSLTVARIPRKRITVFGRGFRWREAVTAPRFVKAAAAGGAVAASGASLILWLLGSLATGVSWLGALAAGGALGGILGVVLGAAAWMLTRRDRSVPETGHVDVDHYEILVETDHAKRARELLTAASSDG